MIDVYKRQGDDRVPGDYFYADEINQLEENLETLNTNTLRMSYGSAPVYNDNGTTMDFNELNRLEGATLDPVSYTHLGLRRLKI